MEKIYDENQQKQQQKKKIKIDGVSMLSFAVALFAIVSLVAAGVSGFSYALPDTDPVKLPDKFTGVQNGDNEIYMYEVNSDLDTSYHYYVDNGKKVPLICLERDIGFAAGQEYQFTSEYDYVSDNAGLLYLLANLAPNNQITYSSDFNVPTNKKDYVDFWVTQNVIWNYLYDTGAKNNANANQVRSKNATWVAVGTDDEFGSRPESANTDTTKQLYFGYGNGSKKIFENAFVKVNGADVKVSDLLANAETKKGLSFDVELRNAEGVPTQDKDKKYYFSPLFTVVPTLSDNSLGALENYALAVKAYDKDKKEVDVGAVVVDKDFKVVNDITKLTPAQLTEFYVRVPSEKVTQNVTVNVGVTATFKMYNGLRYTVKGRENTSQTVTTVQFARNSKDDAKNFDLAPTPDTGISAGQTIYFVGLIVLLCGVGIIYANAKPTQVQN